MAALTRGPGGRASARGLGGGPWPGALGKGLGQGPWGRALARGLGGPWPGAWGRASARGLGGGPWPGGLGQGPWGRAWPGAWGLARRKGPKNPEPDWDDRPGLVIPVCFGVFWPKGAKKASDADRLAVKMRIAEVIYRGKQSVCQRYFPRSYVQLSREREHIQRSS